MKQIVMCTLLCASLWAQGGSGGGSANISGREEHIRQVIASLPPESELRQRLERGAIGDGVRYPWMDKMRQQGVKHLLVRTEFVWRGRPTDVRVARIVYFSKYDWDCAQINDPQRLEQIRASGLEDEIGRVAVQRTLETPWARDTDGHVLKAKHGECTNELFDDEWLTQRFPTSLWRNDKARHPVLTAASMHDEEDVKALVQASVSAEDRDDALWFNLMYDDPCMETVLIKAGADVNGRNHDGSTPLMTAVGFKVFGNVKALLAAGADVNAKANNGQTALSIAVERHDERIIELLKQAARR
jgi:hypothetical protein